MEVSIDKFKEYLENNLVRDIVTTNEDTEVKEHYIILKIDDKFYSSHYESTKRFECARETDECWLDINCDVCQYNDTYECIIDDKYEFYLNQVIPYMETVIKYLPLKKQNRR